MSDILIESHSVTVGEAYKDEWASMYRVVLDEWTFEEKKMDAHQLRRFVEANGYELVDNGYSGSCIRIIDRFKREVCGECGQKCLYDEKLNEFYCSVCE